MSIRIFKPRYYSDVEAFYYEGKTLEEIKALLFLRKTQGISTPKRKQNCRNNIRKAIKFFRFNQTNRIL